MEISTNNSSTESYGVIGLAYIVDTAKTCKWKKHCFSITSSTNISTNVVTINSVRCSFVYGMAVFYRLFRYKCLEDHIEILTRS